MEYVLVLHWWSHLNVFLLIFLQSEMAPRQEQTILWSAVLHDLWHGGLRTHVPACTLDRHPGGVCVIQYDLPQWSRPRYGHDGLLENWLERNLACHTCICVRLQLPNVIIIIIIIHVSYKAHITYFKVPMRLMIVVGVVVAAVVVVLAVVGVNGYRTTPHWITI